jgi:hypothetical protein
VVLRKTWRRQQQDDEQRETDTHVRILAKLSLSLYRCDGYGTA